MATALRFADFVKMNDREVQVLLRAVDQKDLVVALKQTTKALREKLLGNMSRRVRTFIEEEVEYLGPMPGHEIEAVQERIVGHVEKLAAEGHLTIPFGGKPKKPPKQKAAKKPSKKQQAEERRLKELAGKSLAELTLAELTELFTLLGEKARRQGILALEGSAEHMDAFPRMATMLAVDGTEPALIMDMMETWMKSLMHEHEVKYRKVIEGIMAIQAGDNPRIIEHKLSVIY